MHRGIGFILHSRWDPAKAILTPISERLAYLDLDLSTQWKLRVVSACFPHAGYSSPSVEVVYEALDKFKKNALLKGKLLILGGDFNAVVGKRGA